MKANVNIVILGGNITGLYAAVKCVEMGYNVTIIDKKNTIGNVKNQNYKIFNKNHTAFLNLLNKFDIKYSRYDIRKNDVLNTIVSYIIKKAKLIPKKTLITQSFTKFCRNILSTYEYESLRTMIYDFDNIFSNFSTIDSLNMFIYDINMSQEYYILNDHIDVLINRMSTFLSKNNVVFINNTNIKDFKYLNDKFILYSANSINYNSDILITTLSKKNLLSYKFWNKEQKALLNMVSSFNICSSNIYNIISTNGDDISENISEDIDIRKNILEDFHIVFPNIKEQKNDSIYIWDIGVNNIIIREKMKYIYNPFMILCSDSYAKNNLFINYSLELFDSNIPRISKMCSNY